MRETTVSSRVMPVESPTVPMAEKASKNTSFKGRFWLSSTAITPAIRIDR